ncbi:MAG TPA: hypothetical protein DCW90_15400 [Lachnospiraceae bacterium]|nr:hypothetical protein [Lachnospiraceae bacterium]
MKLANATIYDLIAVINKFGDAKGRTAFVFFRALRKLQDEIKDCDEQKNKLIQKYGKEVENGIAIPRDDKEANDKFIREFTPILFSTIEVDIPQLTEDEFNSLCDIAPKDATMNDYALLDAFMVEHPVAEKKEEEEKPEKVEAEVVEETPAE